MINKNLDKKLYAIFKNEIHRGNVYGFDKLDAIKLYLRTARFSISNETINEYNVIEAIEKIHYFKSEYVVMPEKQTQNVAFSFDEFD